MPFRGRDGKIESLKAVPLFSGLSRRSLKLIAAHIDQVRVDKGAVLARQDHLAREFLLVVDGCVRVERDGRDVDYLRAGDWFGELALLEGTPQVATIIAETALELMVVEARSFSYLLTEVPQLQRRLLAAWLGSIRRAADQVVVQTANPSPSPARP